MASSAHVESIESLETFHARLTDFQDRLGKQLDDLRTEVDRIARALEEEAPRYWQEQDRLAKRRWSEARERLLECEATVRADERPGCSEHRKRLERCSVRVALCEKKLRQVKQCQVLWQQTNVQLQMKIQHVRDLQESRLPLARHHLRQIIEPLRQYAQLASAPPTTTSMESTSSPEIKNPTTES